MKEPIYKVSVATIEEVRKAALEFYIKNILLEEIDKDLKKTNKRNIK